MDTLADGIASRLLARHGIAVLWDLQVAAPIVHSTGDEQIAASIMEIADAAEREWLRENVAPELDARSITAAEHWIAHQHRIGAVASVYMM